MKTLCVGLTFDLRAHYLAEGYREEDVAEFDSDVTIDALEHAIRGLGYRVDRIGHARMLAERLVRGDRWDLVFNIAEGLAGRSREAQVPCLLELYGIPYALSDALVCAVTLEKSVAKRLVRDAGVRTPRFHVVRTPADVADVRLAYPLFAKPMAEGTGKGIDLQSRIDAPEALAGVCARLLARYRQPVLVEEYLPGREFTVGILGTGAAARAIGTMEVDVLPSAGDAIYSFEAKEKCDDLVRYTTPEPGPLRAAVEQLALDAYRALECRDAGRVDVRLDGAGLPSFMEVNPLPGLHPHHSDLPMVATRAGMSFDALIGGILESARARYPQLRGSPPRARRRRVRQGAAA